MDESNDDVGATILVVDDEETNRALIGETLREEGYVVVGAAGGEAGVEAFLRTLPDCVLLDARMPGIDGFEVCRRIRTMPHGADTPVLFVTGLRDVETFDHALAVGADDFLTKPIRPAELVVRVQTALKLRRLSLDLSEQVWLLRHQRDQLLRLQLQKERLIAFVIHDLKTPVNAISLQAQLLQRDPGVSGRTRTCVDEIRNETRRLARMIVNLLDVAKAEEGRLSPQRTWVDLRPLLDSVLSELAAAAREHGVELRCAIGESHAFADEDLLRRLLTNLVENAIRYAPSGTDVVIGTAKGGDGTTFRVADTGKGVPEEERSEVFGAFSQLESRADPTARMCRGLGLAFCKHAVDAHGGRIWIEDAAPGAVFCASLPDGARGLHGHPSSGRSAVQGAPGLDAATTRFAVACSRRHRGRPRHARPHRRRDARRHDRRRRPAANRLRQRADREAVRVGARRAAGSAPRPPDSSAPPCRPRGAQRGVCERCPHPSHGRGPRGGGPAPRRHRARGRGEPRARAGA
jgi:signal transduction histidine kinase